MHKKFICFIFGHKWSHPVIRLVRKRKQKNVSFPSKICFRCGLIKYD